MTAGEGGLAELALLYGVQTSYEDAFGTRREPPPEALAAVLAELGAEVATPRDAPAAIAARDRFLLDRRLEPVAVAWQGRPAGIELQLPAERRAGSLACRLVLEDGSERPFEADLAAAPVVETLEAAGERAVRRRLPLPADLAAGYHRLEVEAGGERWSARVIAAPVLAYAEEDEPARWGVFLPLHALYTARSRGLADLADLERLMAATGRLGGSAAGILPILPAFLDQPFDPSPYAPVSRLFWNELYLDFDSLPEAGAAAAREILAARARGRREPAAGRHVSYRGEAGWRRRLLGELARSFFEQATGERRGRFERFRRERPEAERYAAFRATGERRGEPWQLWPEPARSGTLTPEDYAEEDLQAHLYAQWAMAEQIAALGQGEVGLYLDLPLGVHGSAYDVWRWRDLFALGAAGGAPPDPLFIRGQDWGLPPLKPEALRASGYDYLIAALRHHLEPAALLRIDHVMQFHRLFWVPAGFPATAGTYVRYWSEELYAILCLESHRAQAVIVGENLGTVPPEVNEALTEHRIRGMYVLQYELEGLESEEDPLPPVPPGDLAAVNTHDMPTFRAFWEGRDFEIRRQLDLLDDEGEAEERAKRRRILQALVNHLRREGLLEQDDPEPERVLRAALEHLAASPASLLLVNLEDLWGETDPQNVPGTTTELPNWRRRARLSLEEMLDRPEVVEVLGAVDQVRGGRGNL